MMSYPEIRAVMEERGYAVDDAQYEEVVAYARRKAAASGKDESYMPYLLPDVIKEWVVSRAINAVTIAAMTAENLFQQEVYYGEHDGKRMAVGN